MTRSETPDDRRVWDCRDCSFTTTKLDEALAHPWEAAENFGHWLFEFSVTPTAGGWRLDSTGREIHSSDAGGCYLTPNYPIAGCPPPSFNAYQEMSRVKS